MREKTHFLIALLITAAGLTLTMGLLVGQSPQGTPPAQTPPCCQNTPPAAATTAPCCQPASAECTTPECQNMQHMAKDPAMFKQHLTMMITDAELRPAVLALLKKDAELLKAFQKLVSDAKQ